MDNRPIGVFDSGLGGLTGVRELRRRLPHKYAAINRASTSSTSRYGKRLGRLVC